MTAEEFDHGEDAVGAVVFEGIPVTGAVPPFAPEVCPVAGTAVELDETRTVPETPP